MTNRTLLLLLFSLLVLSDSQSPHGLQHGRLLCSSLSHKICHFPSILISIKTQPKTYDPTLQHPHPLQICLTSALSCSIVFIQQNPNMTTQLLHAVQEQLNITRGTNIQRGLLDSFYIKSHRAQIGTQHCPADSCYAFLLSFFSGCPMVTFIPIVPSVYSFSS